MDFKENKNKKLVIISGFVLIFCISLGLVFTASRTHSSIATQNTKKKEYQRSLTSGVVDISHSNSQLLLILDEDNPTQTKKLNIKSNIWAKIKKYRYPFVHITSVYDIKSHQLEKQELEIINTEHEETIDYFDNKEKALQTIDEKLQHEKIRINEAEAYGEMIQDIVFDRKTKEINVKIDPKFSKEREVSKTVLLGEYGKYLAEVYRDDVYHTIWAYEEEPNHIVYNMSDSRIAIADTFGNIEK